MLKRFGTQGRSGSAPAPNRSKIAKTFDAIISVSLVALFFGLPVFFTGLSFQGLVFEKQLYFYFWLLIGLVAWVSKGVLTGEMKIRRTPIDIPVLAFVAVYGLSTIFSVDRWESFWGAFGDPSRGFLSVLALALSYYLITSHFTAARFRAMFIGLVVSSLFVVLWSTLVIMGIQFLPGELARFAPFSLFGTVTTLALFLSVVPALLLTALFVLFRQGFSGVKWYAWVGGALLLLGLLADLFLLLALSPFVSWVVVIGGIGFLLIYILAQIVRPAEQLTWLPMALFVVVLAFLMIGEVNIARANLPVEVMPKFSFAFDIAREGIKDNFLLGAGPANYSYVFSLHRPVEYNQNALFTLRFDQAPGLFLEALSTLGALGTIAYLALILSFISIGIYLLSSGRSRNKIYSLGLWSVSVMFFIASFIAPFNGSVVLVAVLSGILSLSALLWESGAEERYLSLSFQASPKFALALAFIFMVVSAGVAFLFVFIGKVFVADLSAGTAVRAATVSEDSVRSLSRAAQLYPQEPQYHVNLGQSFIALANQEASKPADESDTNRIVAYLREAIARGEAASALSSNNVRVAEALGLIYENGALYTSEALPKALEHYEAALSLEPNSPVLLVKVGQVKRAMAERESDEARKAELFSGAAESLRQAVEKKDNFALAHYNLAVVESRLGAYAESLEALNRAIALEPANITYRYSLGSLYQLRGEEGDAELARSIYEDLLRVNERLVDVRLSLALLLESAGEADQALSEYRRILEFLPEGTRGDTLREQIGVFIETLENNESNVETAGPSLPEPGPETIPLPTEEGATEDDEAPETVPTPELPEVEGGE